MPLYTFAHKPIKAFVRSILILKCFHSRDHGVLKLAFCTYVRPLLEFFPRFSHLTIDTLLTKSSRYRGFSPRSCQVFEISHISSVSKSLAQNHLNDAYSYLRNPLPCQQRHIHVHISPICTHRSASNCTNASISDKSTVLVVWNWPRFKFDTFGDGPHLRRTPTFYEKSTRTLHGRLVRGLLLQEHSLQNSVPECIRTRHFHLKNKRIGRGHNPSPGPTPGG